MLSLPLSLQLVFTDDAQEPAFEMRHKLKLYSGEDTQGNQNPKKPVRWGSTRGTYREVVRGSRNCSYTLRLPYPQSVADQAGLEGAVLRVW